MAKKQATAVNKNTDDFAQIVADADAHPAATANNVVPLKAKKAKRTPAKNAAMTVFDPAKIPVMGYLIKSFRVGRRTFHITLTELDGVGMAAVELQESDAVYCIRHGSTVAYVGGSLCMVTNQMKYIEQVARLTYPAEAIEKVMDAYRTNVGYPLLHPLSVDEFNHERGTPYGVYEGCDEQEDFDGVEKKMLAKYDRILALNAERAVSPLDTSRVFVDSPMLDAQADIVRFALGAIHHEKRAGLYKQTAYRYSDVYKFRHGIAKIDHGDPAYRAFTAVPWDAYIDHREHAKQARSLLKQATERHASKLASKVNKGRFPIAVDATDETLFI